MASRRPFAVSFHSAFFFFSEEILWGKWACEWTNCVPYWLNRGDRACAPACVYKQQLLAICCCQIEKLWLLARPARRWLTEMLQGSKKLQLNYNCCLTAACHIDPIYFFGSPPKSILRKFPMPQLRVYIYESASNVPPVQQSFPNFHSTSHPPQHSVSAWISCAFHLPHCWSAFKPKLRTFLPFCALAHKSHKQRSLISRIWYLWFP